MVPQNIVGNDARPATRKTAGADSTIEESLDIYNKTNENRKMNKKQVIKLSESDLHRIVKKSVNKILKESFDVSRYGDDALEQIDNMQFTNAQKKILDYAFKLEGYGFSDEEYFELAFFFAEHNGLNESKQNIQKKTN